jgi:PAS domain S-box-containing protein
MTQYALDSAAEVYVSLNKKQLIRVLHVDDESSLLKVAKQCLEMQGPFQVDTASCVEEALEKMKKETYDAVVCDFQMPGRDGLEFLKELREKGNAVPFIIFTGKGREEVAMIALNLGADQYIDKHGDPEAVYHELAHSISVAVERRKAETALFAERDRLETVTRNIGAGLAIISKDYRTLWANDVLKRLFGDVESKICYSTYNQRNSICLGCGVRGIFETGKDKVVHEQVGKDVYGKTVWSEITATPVKDKDGNVVAALELVVPITERKKIEETLRDSEEKYRKLFDEAMDAIFVADAETGILVDCNHAAARLFGKEKSELIGKHQRILHPPEKNEGEFSTTFKQHLKEKEGQVLETQVIAKNGEVKEVLIKANVFELGGKEVVQGIFKDITEHAWLSSFPERNPNPILEVDLNGNTTYLNPAAQTLFHLQGLKLKNDFEKELETLVDEFKTHRKGNFVRENVKIGDRYYQQSIHYFHEKTALRLYMIDVTERKEAEEQIKKASEELNRTFDAIPDLMFIIDRDNRLVRVNKKTCDFLKKRPEELLGKHCYEVMHGTDRPWSNCPHMKTLETKEPASAEIDDPRMGIRLLVVISPVFDEKGDFVQCVHTAKDITERKKMEESLRENKEKFEGLFMGNPEAAVCLSPGFLIQDINPRFEALFGYSLDEIKGKHINDVVAPEDMREEAERLDKDAKKGYASHDTVRKRKDGSLVPVSISAAPVTLEDKLLGYVGLYKDITELKKARVELEETERHFHTSFNLMADPVVIVEKSGKILEVTQKTTELTGFKKEELIGKNFLKMKMATAKTKAILIKNLAKRMMGMHIQPYEVEILTKDGRKLQYEINASRIEYKGKPADLVVFRDILERKKLEEKLRVVGGLTRHDVRNKLSAVTGNAYLLRQKMARDPKALEQLKDIEAAIRHVETIFEFARTYEKLGVETLNYMDLGETIDEALSLFSNMKGVKIVNECHKLVVLGDSLLRQLFFNLIDNSLKHGDKIQQIRVYYKTPSAGMLELLYEDDGAGIPDNVRSNLFVEGAGRGTGHGLFMIKRICEVYGWTIRETGTTGKGAQFTMTIPKTNQNGRENYQIA